MAITRRAFTQFLATIPLVSIATLVEAQPKIQDWQRQSIIPLLANVPGEYSMNVRTTPTGGCDIEVTRYDAKEKKSVPVWLGGSSITEGLEDAKLFLKEFSPHSRIFVYVVGRWNTAEFVQYAWSLGRNVSVAVHV
jgi:hypothetical protein